MKTLLAMICVTLIALIASPVHAGSKDPSPVIFVTNPDNTVDVYGSLGGAHNSPDSMQQIGCNYVYQLGGTPYVYCYATDANGRFGSCITNSTAIFAMNSDSLIHFGWNSLGQCRVLEIRNSSQWPSKQQ